MIKTLLTFAFLAIANSAFAADPWRESYRLEKEGKFADAVQQIEPFVKGQAFAQLRKAWLLYRAGRFDESVAGYRHAREMNPDSIDAMLGITLPLMAQWKFGEATDVTRKVLRYAPWHYAASIRLLELLEAQKDWFSLTDEAKSLAIRYPSDATVLVYLARGQVATGNPDYAKEAYRRVLQIIPEHIEATVFLKR